MKQLLPTPTEAAHLGISISDTFENSCREFYLRHPLLSGLYLSINNILR